MHKKYKLEVIHDDIQFLVHVIYFQIAIIKRVTAIQKIVFVVFIPRKRHRQTKEQGMYAHQIG